MKYLLHGDDITSSRKYLTEISDGYNSINLDGIKLTVALLEENMLSTGLFDEKKVVVVENLFAKNKKKKDIVEFVNKVEFDDILIFWEDKKIPKPSFSSLKNATVKEFSFPSFYFQFLDSFIPSEKKRVFTLYHELLKTYSSEQVFYSLLKRVRYLVILSAHSTTDELTKMNPWMRDKMQKQQARWERSRLMKFYESLQNTEIKLKTGKLPVDLSKHLDILILSQL